MNEQIASWIASILSALVMGQVAWISYLTRRLSRLEVHIAENYVSSKSLSDFDARTTSALNKVEQQIDKILETLYELKGQAAGKG